MSDVKEVGVVGQEYEERTSGKRGVLDSRDDKCKTLLLIGPDGKGFNVSYSSFRSRWRKVQSQTEETKVQVEETTVQAERKPVVIGGPVETVYDNDGFSFVKDGIKIIVGKFNADDTISVMCLPDIYTDSIELHNYVNDFTCMPVKSGLDIRFKLSKELTFTDFAELVKDAAENINLYAYVESEE